MKSLSFGWKRKLPKDVTASASSHFAESSLQEENDDDNPFELDWLHLKKRKTLHLEDRATKADRLTSEGISLAEEER